MDCATSHSPTPIVFSHYVNIIYIYGSVRFSASALCLAMFVLSRNFGIKTNYDITGLI